MFSTSMSNTAHSKGVTEKYFSLRSPAIQVLLWMEGALFARAKLHTSTKTTHSARQGKASLILCRLWHKRYKERAQLPSPGKAVDTTKAGGDTFVLLSGRLEPAGSSCWSQVVPGGSGLQWASLLLLSLLLSQNPAALPCSSTNPTAGYITILAQCSLPAFAILKKSFSREHTSVKQCYKNRLLAIFTDLQS